MALNVKQQRFIDEYMIDLNATQAAIRAGYSAKTANEQGARLLANVSVRDEVNKRLDKRSKRLEWTAEDIMRDLQEIAQNLNEATKDRLKAYELAGKHLKMFTDKIEQTGHMQMDHNHSFNLSKLSDKELDELEKIIDKAAE